MFVNLSAAAHTPTEPCTSNSIWINHFVLLITLVNYELQQLECCLIFEHFRTNKLDIYIYV